MIFGCVLLLCGVGAAWLPTASDARSPQDSPSGTSKQEDQKPAGDTPVPQQGSDAPAAAPATQGQGKTPTRLHADPRLMNRRPVKDQPAVPGAGDVEELEAGLPGPPPDGRRWMEGGFGRGRSDLNPEMIERLLEVVRDLDADRAVRLEALRSSDPHRFSQVLSRSGRHLLGLSLLKDRDPDLYEMKLAELRVGQQINRIAQEIRAARDTCSEEELERLTTMLRDRLREQSDHNFRARAREIVLLENHLKTTREKLVEDITRSRETIEERLAELLHTPHEHDEPTETLAADDQPKP